jgi:hypothetical protein
MHQHISQQRQPASRTPFAVCFRKSRPKLDPRVDDHATDGQAKAQNIEMEFAMRTTFLALGIAAIACTSGVSANAQATGVDQSAATFVATLAPMNSKVAGSETSGEARFTIKGDTLTIEVNVKGAPPNIEHWQHFHGFKDNRNSTCPMVTADTNHDGIIDLIETESAAGTTMVPFDDDPASMQVATGTYPKTSVNGAFQYHKTVSLKALSAAFAKAFGNQNLDLDQRVVFIHGVFPSTKLPASVASLGPIPAHVTLPIACGKIKQIEK